MELWSGAGGRAQVTRHVNSSADHFSGEMCGMQLKKASSHTVVALYHTQLILTRC